jgi:uncharacterized membrane protein
MTDERSILLRTVEWLLGLEHIRLGHDAPVHWRWNSPLPGWLVLGLALLLLVLIVLTYRREQIRFGRRVLLISLRAALAGLVLALLCHPVLILQRDLVSPGNVAVLVDTSASMSQVDRTNGVADGGTPAGTSRLDLARQALTAEDAAALRTLLAHNDVRIFQFSDDVRPVATAAISHAARSAAGAGPVQEADVEPLRAALAGLAADGTSTHLGEGLDRVLRHGEGGRLAAVVLVSDGQSTEPGSLAAVLAVAKAQQVPIYPLLVGSPIPPRDVGVASVTCDSNVFAKDVFSVRVVLAATGLPEPTPVSVQLVDEARARVVAAQTVMLGGETVSREVELRAKPGHAGRLRYRVDVLPIEGDTDAENNTEVVDVNVRDEPARVLYVEQAPRFEYRYLKTALVREETLRTSVLLLGADADFAQEGTAPIRRFPETAEELEGYDVVLFGDVDPAGDWLSAAQAEMLVDFVGRRGGGFGLIAGERNAPHRFRGTPLEKLIPVRIDPDFLGAYTETLTTAFVPRVTPDGRRSRLFQLGRPGAGNSATGGAAAAPNGAEASNAGDGAELVAALPGWYWFARTLGPKPGAEVLLEHPAAQAESGAMPLVVVGRYGAGKVLFHGSDDTWRWRRGSGELLYDGYWIQVVRTLLPARANAADRRVAIRPQKRRYHYGERVDVQVEVRSPELLRAIEDQVCLVVHDRDGRSVAKLDATRLGGVSPLFEGSFTPPGAGSFTLVLDEGAVAPNAARAGTPSTGPVEGAVVTGEARTLERPEAVIEVERASLEFRRREADHALLEHLAAETGGRTVALDESAVVFGEIRDRSVRIPDDVSETLWDSKLALILFGVLITTEWILRKAYGMI